MEAHSEVSVVRVHIRGEDLVETSRKQGPANGDLTQLDEYLDDRVGFLVLRASPSSWYVVTWMPEGKVSVNNRMVYAASQSSLKAAVGEDSIAECLQFTARDEVLGGNTTTTTHTVEYERVERRVEHRSSVPVIAPKPQAGVFVKKADPRLAMSRSELEHVDLLKQEDEARAEQLEQMRTRLGTWAPMPTVAARADNQHVNTAGIKQTEAAASGGFHSVTLPLSASAKEALSGFAANVGTTVVELQVDANKHVSSAQSFSSTEEFAPSAGEPRFYVMRTPGSRAFVYLCPEASPPRLRMVYSTASTATLEQIQKLGCRITHRLALFSPQECTLVAVAATIRNGQAQRVGDDKDIDSVVNYQPSEPARSLPSRFSAASTKLLDAFTDEGGFRKAFANVRPDAPVPAPFRSPVASRQSSFTSATSNDAVDSAPNSGAAAWGVKLKSKAPGSGPRSVASSASNFGTPNTSANHAKSGNVATLSTRFSQTKLAGEAGDDSPPSRDSNKSSPITEFAEINTVPAKPEPEIMRSSLPGLRSVPGPRSSAALAKDDKWDPWRPVNASNAASKKDDAAPESALQSSVYAASGGPSTGTISDFMSDITYPPLQNAASRENPEVR
ncbi:Twinfilin-1 [Coemansia erecta]|nr:Twinfilin-1 [Coemansia erecta]